MPAQSNHVCEAAFMRSIKSIELVTLTHLEYVLIEELKIDIYYEYFNALHENVEVNEKTSKIKKKDQPSRYIRKFSIKYSDVLKFLRQCNLYPKMFTNKCIL